ncbi:MAG: hypothetical protein WC605_12370, partial [Bacteroidales bacterium]
MITSKQTEKIQKFIKPYRITDGKNFKLKAIDPDDMGEFGKNDKDRLKEALEEGIAQMRELQEKLYADNKWGVLLIFQA